MINGGLVKSDFRESLPHTASGAQVRGRFLPCSLSLQLRRTLPVASTPLLDLSASFAPTVGFESRPLAHIPGWASRIRQAVPAVWCVACGGCWRCGKTRRGRTTAAWAPPFFVPFFNMWLWTFATPSSISATPCHPYYKTYYPISNSVVPHFGASRRWSLCTGHWMTTYAVCLNRWSMSTLS